jgi:hypothetical protein
LGLFQTVRIRSLRNTGIALDLSRVFGDAESKFLLYFESRPVELFEGNPLRHELNVLALYRGNEKYYYVFDDASREALIEVIRAQASNPKISLSWFDAAVLTERARVPSKQTNPQES